MRLAAYAGASTALAAGAILRAFHERPNFYSASVYLAQSSACRMILANFLLLSAGALLFCLQRVLYGPLRAIEIEQLWERGWYTITETALAMTTFRDEVGVWFFVMFVCLLAGKVWGWISESRVEMLEQQPPANPKLFHARLAASLLLSELFGLLMFRYCVRTLLDQPRPGMMVMFAFEYAILTITSSSTCARYALSLKEIFVVKSQTKARLEERQEELRAAREEAQREPPASSSGSAANLAPEDIDENDIDVPGWQEKGRWVLFLDLLTDFLKLFVYISFFSMLIMFHGLPIHIIRDLYLTTRSFYKRINDYLKYRNATRDMNSRYPDATAEDLQRDGTCIICREDMRPWQQPQPARVPAAGAPRRPQIPTDERQRPKKLPCGHILHFGCLRSWLERQQVCPTCRRSVLVAENPRNENNQVRPNGANNAIVVRPRDLVQGRQPPDQQQQPQAPLQQHQRNQNEDQNQNQNQNQNQQQQQRAQPPQQRNQQRQGQNDWRARTFNLGALRVTFAAGNPRQFQDAIRQMQDQNDNQQNGTDRNNVDHRIEERGNTAISEQIASLERQIVEDINHLNASQEQLGAVRALQAELTRLRSMQANPALRQGPHHPPGPSQQQPWTTFAIPPGQMHAMQQNPALARNFHPHPAFQPQPHGMLSSALNMQQHVFGGHTQAPALGPSDPALPEGMTIPEGWSLLPLQRHSASPLGLGAPTSSNSDGEPQVLGQVQPSIQPTQETLAALIPRTVDRNSQEEDQLALDHVASAATQVPDSTTAPSPSETSFSQAHTEPLPQNSLAGASESSRSISAIPDWSSSAGLPTDTAQDSSIDNNKGGDTDGLSRKALDGQVTSEGEHEGGQGNGHVSVDKGKGKAVTIEDEVDQESGL